MPESTLKQFSPVDVLSDSTTRTSSTEYAESGRYPEPDDADKKWPAWAVTLFVLTFCGAFWAGVGYLAMKLLG